VTAFPFIYTSHIPRAENETAADRHSSTAGTSKTHRSQYTGRFPFGATSLSCGAIQVANSRLNSFSEHAQSGSQHSSNHSVRVRRNLHIRKPTLLPSSAVLEC
jgi:hypothetical protein